MQSFLLKKYSKKILNFKSVNFKFTALSKLKKLPLNTITQSSIPSTFKNTNQKFNFSSSSPCSSTTTCTKSNSPIFDYNTKDYYVEQLTTSCLSQFAYYIESNGEACVIDPMRECDSYIEILKNRKAKLKYILETHFHADFVSGHLELSKLTGAKIVYGPNAQTKLNVLVAKDEQLLPLGDVNIKVFHTPGHTLESTSYVLLDSNKYPKAMFTGDFLFLGEVGRPDLAVKSNLTKEDLAEMIYNSIQRLKREYSDDLVIFPGHGAGSACGKSIAKGSCDTLKNQKLTNYAMNDKLTKEEFISSVTKNLPTPPEYFFYDAMLNIKGADDVKTTLEQANKGIEPKELIKLIKEDPTIKVIDTREFSKSKPQFLKGSYLIPLSLPYAVWVASLLSPKDKIVLITEKGQEKESIVRLLRVGFDNIIGFLNGPFEGLKNLKTTNSNEIKSVIEKNINNKEFEVIDVRDPNECLATGVVQNAHLFPLKNIEKEIEKVKLCVGNKPLGVYCKTGGRAVIAASILKKHNFKDVFVLGGTNLMIEKNCALSK